MSTDLCSIQNSVLRLGYILTLCFVVIAVDYASAYEENHEVILLEEWPQTQTSLKILELPQIREILKNFNESKMDVVEIRFPGGAEGRLWGESIAEWLTAFGLPGDHLKVIPGSGAADRVVLEIIQSP